MHNKRILLIGSQAYENEYFETLTFIREYGTVCQVYIEKEEIEYSDIPYINDDGQVNVNNETILFDIIVIIEPLYYFSGEGFARLLRYELFAPKLWLISYPDRKIYGRVYDKLKSLYEKGRQIDYEKTFLLGENIKDAIEKHSKYRIIGKEGTNLLFERISDKIFIETGTIEDRVSQMPGGEVFFAISNCNGILSSSALGEDITIRDGIALLNGEEYFVCEFGMGLNENIKYIKHLAINEKAFGTCHFGFGNNIAFGGTSDLNYHFDITIFGFELYGVTDGGEVRLI